MRKIFMCKEMEKLRIKLSKMGISWEDKSEICSDEKIEQNIKIGKEPNFADTSTFRTHFHYNGIFFSVINGWSTYGGYDPFDDINRGLLEVMYVKDNNDEEIIGPITTEEVISLMKEVSRR